MRLLPWWTPTAHTSSPGYLQALTTVCRLSTLFFFSVIINNHFMGSSFTVKRLLHKALTFLCGETAPTAFSTAILGLFPADSLVKR